MKELIVDKSGITCNISDDLFARLEEEKTRFLDWLQSVDDDPNPFTTTLVGVQKSGFGIDRGLDDMIFQEIVSHHDNAYDFSFNPQDINEGEDMKEIYSAVFVLLILNYEDVRNKIKEVRDKLGGQHLESIGGNDFFISFVKNT